MPVYHAIAVHILASSQDIFSVRNVCGTVGPRHSGAIFWEYLDSHELCGCWRSSVTVKQ